MDKNPSPIRQIDPESAESFIGEKKIGERIKRLRLKRSMGLVEMGRHTGLSASFLSQLETGRVVPTLRNLARVAMVFGKDLSYFFESEPHTLFRVHRKADRVRLPQSGAREPTYFFESLGYLVPDRTLDPYLAEFISTKKPDEVRPHVHQGFEFLYVLDGQMEIRHGNQMYTLDSGDSAYFDASTPHSYRCSGGEKTTVIIVTQHQSAVQAPMTLRPVGTSMPELLRGGAQRQSASTQRSKNNGAPTRSNLPSYAGGRSEDNNEQKETPKTGT